MSPVHPQLARARLIRGLRWYLKEISGAGAYERFAQQHRQQHPGTPVPTRREFERRKTQRRENHPPTGCC
ncbi:MAG TPA: YbdD/YjiX family protein [Amycolatopsis sp.]|uniref:YbdD/YjiX family protein n=1 Tax=Amycolatopsis sp. TaxID=37632 RepID=UPI002B45E9DF|nr:YbdD/YjiX family protein [Amycolatopsis sp.]HKS47182.1 YbdD/YjiX family protein [Amycolatopsis sp.]